MKKIFLFVLLLFVIGWGYGFAAQSRESLALPAAGLKSLHVDCGAGYLKVRGVEGLEQIEVSATLVVRGIAESDLASFKKEYVTLKLEKDTGRAVLIAKIEADFFLAKLFGGGHDARIDLDVRVPQRLSLAIDDGSGDIDVRAVDGDVNIDDGSGNINLAVIHGHVEIEDGSGDIILAEIAGSLQIEDGSGDIKVNDAGNDVDIDDGSGQIELNRIRGSVIIDDGSGDIVIDGVEKDVRIDEAGSGDVEIRNVKGRVKK